PVLAGRGAERGRAQRRRVRAARRPAAALRGPRGSRLSRRDGTRPHAHRRLQRGPRRTDDGPRAGDDGPSRLRSLPGAMIRTLWFYVVVGGATLPGSTRFVGKEELVRIPLLGRAMHAAGHITIDRAVKKRAFEAYDKAAGTIRRGFSAVVFPEGTRSRTGELLPFKNAPFALAIAAQVPLVPVYVHSTFQILPKGGFRLRPRPIRILVGEPITTAGMTPEDRERLRDRTRAAILALKARVDGGPASP